MLVRSVLFAIYMWGSAGVIGLTCLPALFSRRASLGVSKAWARSVLWVLRVLCRVDYRVLGAERLPRGAGLVAAKHQAAWETLALTVLLDQPCFVLKKELSRIPVFGWFCRADGFVFVDRKDGARALRSMTGQARDAAARGAQVVIFPEGTRAAVGAGRPYQPGVAALAKAIGTEVVPVAHDSGRFWTAGLLRRPGTITLSVLSPVPAGLSRKALLAELEEAIEPATRELEAEAAP